MLLEMSYLLFDMDNALSLNELVKYFCV